MRDFLFLLKKFFSGRSLFKRMFGEAERCRNDQGNCESIKICRFHLCESVSEGGEAAVFEQKRQSSEGGVCDREVFPRHVQQQRLRTLLCSRRDSCLVTALCLSLPGSRWPKSAMQQE